MNTAEQNTPNQNPLRTKAQESKGFAHETALRSNPFRTNPSGQQTRAWLKLSTNHDNIEPGRYPTSAVLKLGRTQSWQSCTGASPNLGGPEPELTLPRRSCD